MIQTKFGSNFGLVVSEEKIFDKVYEVRRTPSDGNSSHGSFGPGELKNVCNTWNWGQWQWLRELDTQFNNEIGVTVFS